MRRGVLALVLFAAAGRLAAQVTVSIPDSGAVRAGATATIEWRGLPPETEELEILLSVEGRELPIRLTPQLAARAGVLSWRVPNLPSRRARLTLRYDAGGLEVESGPSAAFEILPEQNEPPAALVFRDGEWWADAGNDDPLRGSFGAASDGRRVEEERESSPCAGSSVPLAQPGRPEPRIREARSAPGPAMTALHFLRRKPLEVPARI